MFQRVVGVEPQDLEAVSFDGAMIAASEEESIARSLQTNPKVLLAQAEVKVANAEIDKEAAPLYPRLDLEVIGNNNRHNNGKEETTYSATFLLGAGLMTLVFFSNRCGYDERSHDAVETASPEGSSAKQQRVDAR